MNVLLIGSGGRESAIAWKLQQSSRLHSLHRKYSIQKEEYLDLVSFCKAQAIDLVVIGSETPLADGLSDFLTAHHIAVFGPSQAAAQIETSKAFCKDFMSRHQIPTARYACLTAYDDAKSHLEHITYPYVIKASGLAAGKGVFLPDTHEEALQILRSLMQEKALGDCANTVVIEERLVGKEVSLLCFTDGKTYQPMPPAQDYKRLYDDNKGPNTGGMGAYAPVELPTKTLQPLYQRILEPTIQGLQQEGMPFVGVLYAGIMLTNQGPYVLEFNCRLGDPETQVLLPLLENDLIDVMTACVSQRLEAMSLRWKPQSAVCVVLASAGYPHQVTPSTAISGLHDNHDALLFHAGTTQQGHETLATGGRVMGIMALAGSLQKAREKAYQCLSSVHFAGMQYRRDIADVTSDVYASAGVNIKAGSQAVELMKEAVRSTYSHEVLAGIGAFGGMFDAARIRNMHQPVLVASTDGVGTKVELAIKANQIEGLGFDIVNHSINDILVQGASPLFFLDYIASHQLDPQQVATIVTSMALACKQAGCALLGGETAEMPGTYADNQLDIAGTIVGVVEKEQALPKKTLQSGDMLIGLASTGPHTNGYSLIRKLFAKDDIHQVLPELNMSLANALLKPHRSYLPILTPILQHSKSPIKALIHITGGGFWENIPRVLPTSLSAVIHTHSWPTPPLFALIQERGSVSFDEMHRVFNMGIGMILVIDPTHAPLIKSLLAEPCFEIGFLKPGNQTVEFA